MYLDSLLVDLSKSGVGCYWGSFFAGAFAYADDVVLLAPCAAALRIMLSICSRYALSHKLEFNASKTKLICFSSCLVRPHNTSIFSTTFCYEHHSPRSYSLWMTLMTMLKEF